MSKNEDELPYHNNHHRRVFYNVDIIHYYKLLFEVLFCTSSIFLIFQFLYRIISQHILSVIKFHLWHLLLPLLLLQVLLLQVLQPIPLCLLSQPLWLLSLISSENIVSIELVMFSFPRRCSIYVPSNTRAHCQKSWQFSLHLETQGTTCMIQVFFRNLLDSHLR